MRLDANDEVEDVNPAEKLKHKYTFVVAKHSKQEMQKEGSKKMLKTK